LFAGFFPGNGAGGPCLSSFEPDTHHYFRFLRSDHTAGPYRAVSHTWQNAVNILLSSGEARDPRVWRTAVRPRDDLEASCAGSGGRATEGESIEWRVFGFCRHRFKTVLLLAAIAGIALLVHYAFSQFLFDLLAVAFQLFATRAYWLPVKYRLDTDGVAITTADRKLLCR